MASLLLVCSRFRKDALWLVNELIKRLLALFGDHRVVRVILLRLLESLHSRVERAHHLVELDSYFVLEGAHFLSNFFDVLLCLQNFAFSLLNLIVLSLRLFFLHDHVLLASGKEAALHVWAVSAAGAAILN